MKLSRVKVVVSASAVLLAVLITLLPMSTKLGADLLTSGEHDGGRAGNGAPRLTSRTGKRAYAVSFHDVHDFLALDRAHALWVSLDAFKEQDEDIVAIVPRYAGQHLDAPLEEIGYRVIPRDGPAPAWKVRGRWVAQVLASIRAGSMARMEGGSRANGWDLLALEAIALEEYEEVVVFDQKTIIFPVVAERPETGTDREEESKRHHRQVSATKGHEEAGVARVARNEETTTTVSGTMLSSLVPQGHGWTVAFAVGRSGSVLAPGPGLDLLAKGHQNTFSGQHPALMAVRPNDTQYEALSELLCEGDEIIFGEYSGLPQDAPKREEFLRLMVPSIPLLHLAVAALTPPSSHGATASAAAGSGPGNVSRTQPSPHLVGGEVRYDNVVGVEIDISPRLRIASTPLRTASAEGEVKEAGGEGDDGGVVLNVGWIPGDPCSCVVAPGKLGEACRGWLWTRWIRSSSKLLQSVEEGVPEDKLVSALSVCGKDGKFASLSPLPPPTKQQASAAAATAGASYGNSSLPFVTPSKEGGERGGRDGARTEEEAEDSNVAAAPIQPPSIPLPVWRERKPEEKGVVTEADRKRFAHFWLANVEKKLLLVVIPKVACTQFHALFLRLLGSDGWDARDLWKIHFHQDQKKYTVSTMPDLTAEKATDILNDPSWTKAVFLRDPAERMVSCYMDKIVHRRSYSVNFFHTQRILSFEEFVGLTSKGAQERYRKDHPKAQLGLTRRSNPHWRPQYYFGLDKYLPYFDFVGDFQHVEAHSEALLRHTGLWDEFGASGWGPEGSFRFFHRATVEGHATGSHDSKSQYLTPPLLASIMEAYGPTDYRMMADLGWWNESDSLLRDIE